MPRPTRIVRSIKAGCFDCFGSDAHWFSANAQGLAAQHHDRTGHVTWVEVHMTVYYGEEGKKDSDEPPGLF